MDTTAARLAVALADRYRIEREIGSGGMATVFLAWDIRHEREVALKVLHTELAATLGTERFLAEIRTTARLRHPHILPLHDSGEADGLLYYVMPYVAGETLRQRLEREGQLPVDEAVTITRALAGALEYAHRQDVIHRDLKPENVLFLEGMPVLADFGIALAVSAAGGARLTRTGLFIGTPAYASPEQATGERSLGPAADVYSLGAVTYEMLTGEPPFSGATAEAVVARVMLDQPRPIRTVRPSVPPALEAAVLRALAKTPRERFGSMAELDAALAAATGEIRAGSRGRRWAIVAAAAVTILIGASWLALSVGRSRAPAQDAVRRPITFSGEVLLSAISPDGESFAYAVLQGDRTDVLLKDLASDDVDTVASLTGVGNLDWSPDSTRLLVQGFDERSRPAWIIVPRAGGSARRLVRAHHYSEHARWLPDGTRFGVVSAAKDLVIVDVETEDTTVFDIPGDHTHVDGWDFSGTHGMLAVAVEWRNPLRAELQVILPDGTVHVALTDTMLVSSPIWSAAGDAIYYARGNDEIWRVGISARTGRVRGDPEPVLTQIEGLPSFDVLKFDMTADENQIVYVSGRRHSNLHLITLPADSLRPIATVALTEGTHLRWGAAVSPDGSEVAYAQGSAGDGDIFVMSMTDGRTRRVTTGARVHYPGELAWSPEGDRIAFVSERGGHGQIWTVDVVAGTLALLRSRGASTFLSHLDWAPGQAVAYEHGDNWGIRLADGDSVVIVLPDTRPEYAFSPEFSPDGRRLAWLRHSPDESRRGLHVTNLDDGSVVRLSNKVAVWPTGWSADGRYVYAQLWSQPALMRFDTHADRPHEPETIASLPFREVDCVPVPSSPHGRFVCTAFDFVSDAVLVDGLR